MGCVAARAAARCRSMSAATTHTHADDESGTTAFTPWLYYWDDRDGPQYQGWWLAPEVGSDGFMAFSNGDVVSPEHCSAWQTGEAWITRMRVAQLENGMIGVRAPGMGFEGVYQHEVGHPHNHGNGRRVFRRHRDFELHEVSRLDGSEPDIVTYTSGLSLDELQPSAEPPIGEPVVGVAANPMGVIGVPTVSSILDWVGGGGGGGRVVQGVPLVDAPNEALAERLELAGEERDTANPTGEWRMTRSVLVEAVSDLDEVFTKGADEVVSIPGLHDEASPLPVGWVVVARSTDAITRTVKEYLLIAAQQLESELPAVVSVRPEVHEKTATIRQLLASPQEGEAFTVCVWAQGQS